jgi:hypothetical protein
MQQDGPELLSVDEQLTQLENDEILLSESSENQAKKLYNH